MKNGPLISVIVPVYNVQDYLRECIDSIINQTYENLEIILVDDGSIDDSAKICDEYEIIDNRIKVIHKTNGGVSDARNAGMKLSKGEFIQFIDSDDFIENDMIEVLYNLIKNNDAQIAICNHYVYSTTQKDCDYDSSITIYNKKDGLKELMLGVRIWNYVYDKLFSRKLFDELEFPTDRQFEDIIIMPKLFSRSNNIIFYNYPKYYYRQRKGSIIANQSVSLCEEYVYAINDVVSYMKTKNLEIDIYISYLIVHATINLYNTMGLFNLSHIKDNDNINSLYIQTKEIMSNNENEIFIIQMLNNVRKVHLYYMLTDIDEYLKNNKKLPFIYIENKNNI